MWWLSACVVGLIHVHLFVFTELMDLSVISFISFFLWPCVGVCMHCICLAFFFFFPLCPFATITSPTHPPTFLFPTIFRHHRACLIYYYYVAVLINYPPCVHTLIHPRQGNNAVRKIKHPPMLWGPHHSIVKANPNHRT